MTIPTGGRDPPSIAQLGTMALTNVHGVAITCHIDNIRLCGLRTDVLLTEKQLLYNAHFVGMQITIENSAVMSYNFLGVNFWHISAPDTKAIAKSLAQFKIRATEHKKSTYWDNKLVSDSWVAEFLPDIKTILVTEASVERSFMLQSKLFRPERTRLMNALMFLKGNTRNFTSRATVVVKRGVLKRGVLKEVW